MDPSRTAGLNVYLPTYLGEQFRAYASRQSLSPSALIEKWVEDADLEAIEASWGSDFRLPKTARGQDRLALRVTPEARLTLNEAALILSKALGGEPVSARRFLRWLIEYRLQALGEL